MPTLTEEAIMNLLTELMAMALYFDDDVSAAADAKWSVLSTEAKQVYRDKASAIAIYGAQK